MPQPSWLGVMERAQRRRPGIVTGRTMSSEARTPVGLYHNVCGTLNGRSLADGSMLYGCTCNLSVDLGRVELDFDMTFTEVRPPGWSSGVQLRCLQMCARMRGCHTQLGVDTSQAHAGTTARGLALKHAWLLPCCSTRPGLYTSEWPVLTGNDVASTQAAFEDVEFCVRARKAGVPVTYDPDAIVRHHYDCTWLGLFRCR
jgi:hypothetical protein